MRKFIRRLSAILHRRTLQQELAEEMAAHREMMPAGRRHHFGNSLHLQEQAIDQWGWTFIEQFRQDLAYGARSLSRSPEFALTAIAVLSLGIGVNLAEVHAFNALLHRLDVREPDTLRRFFRVTKSGTMGGVSVPAIEFYRRNNTVLSAVFAEIDVDGLFLEHDSEALPHCNLVNGNYFGELGLAPVYGRLLDEQDARPGSPPVAVLGYGYWQSRFGGDPDIVGKMVRLNDKPVEVVGIAPPNFAGVVQQPTSVWLPISQYPYLTGDSRLLLDYGMQRTSMLGRLKPGVSTEAAEVQFRSLTAQLRSLEPQYVDRSEWLKAQPADIPPNPSPGAVLLLATCVLLVLLVLLSACANLGNMLLARGFARQREIEIRLAIGAGRWRLVRQLMTENLLLAAVSSLAALLVGRVAAQILLRVIEAPPNLRVMTDWRIVLVCVALGLLATFAFGLAPALQLVRRGPSATRARKILVAVQVAASCVLLILSSFFARAVQHTFATTVTFDYAGMALADPGFYRHNYTPAEARQAALEIAARTRRLPGIEAASVVTIPPLRRSWIEHIFSQQVYLNEVDPSYFPMMRLSLLQGRIFAPVEPDAVVIGESAARRLWPNDSPLGKAVPIGQRSRTVIGVVKDSGANLMNYPESVEAYMAIDDKNAIYATVLIHATNSPGPLSGSIRSAATLPGLAPLVFTFQGLIDKQLDTRRKMVTVVVSLGAIASLLALLGIFGLLAFTVAQRTREIGVRMALGARTTDVLRCIIGQYAFPLGTGAVVGVALAAGAAKVARTLLYGFLPIDVASFGAGLLLFALIALAASIAPARRALRVDPSSALRSLY
jgi:predicted permease